MSDIIYEQKAVHARFSYGAGVILFQLIDIPILNSLNFPVGAKMSNVFVTIFNSRIKEVFLFLIKKNIW